VLVANDANNTIPENPQRREDQATKAEGSHLVRNVPPHMDL
jgi:hypothetical protein